MMFVDICANCHELKYYSSVEIYVYLNSKQQVLREICDGNGISKERFGENIVRRSLLASTITLSDIVICEAMR